MKRAPPVPIASALLCAAVVRIRIGAGTLRAGVPDRIPHRTVRIAPAPERRRCAPQAVTVIDQETIRASGVREIPELFRMVPGFNVSYVAHVKGLQPIVSYHGLGREFFSRLQVLIDGRSMNNATLGGVDWNDFPLALDDIERIEVVRGPSTATARHRRVPGDDQFHHQASVRSSVAPSRASTPATTPFSTAWRATPRATEGFDPDHGRTPVGQRIRERPGQPRARLRDGYAPTGNSTRPTALMVQAGVTNRTSGVGTGTAVDPERNARFETGLRTARWERSLDADNGLSAQLVLLQLQAAPTNITTDPLPQFNNERFPVDDSSPVRRTDLEVQQTFSVGTRLARRLGRRRARRRRAGAAAAAAVRASARGRLFGHVEWRATDTVLVNVGAMVENNNLTGTDVAPQVAVNYRSHRTT